MSESPRFSVVVPVYNRPQEVDELLASLAQQSHKDFEVILVEDGSDERCEHIAKRYQEDLNITYFFKENTGPGHSRNFGIERANGEFVILFDSDCLIPANYFALVSQHLEHTPLDFFGGPDNEHPSFSIIQKAINYAMTSFITTGGIRGRKAQLDKFQPRSFNMGIKTQLMREIGGFGDIHPGEDPDVSYRLMNKGYSSGLIYDAFVYHKRRIDFRKFFGQVYKFGVVRVILGKWHPGTMKLVYFLPTLFLLGSLLLILLSILFGSLFLIPLALVALLTFAESLVKSGNLLIALSAVLASFLQLYGYGFGFLKSFVTIKILSRQEREAFPGFFFTHQ